MARYTIQFEAYPWRDAPPSVFTEFIELPGENHTEHEVLVAAIRGGGARWAKENNKNVRMVLQHIQSVDPETKQLNHRLLAIADGFVSMFAKRAIPKRRKFGASVIRATARLVFADRLESDNVGISASDDSSDDWWSKLSTQEQEKYLEDHPNSKKAKQEREKKLKEEQGPTADDQPAHKKVVRKIHQTVKQWHAEQKSFFDKEQDKAGSDTRRAMAQLVKDKAKGLVTALKHEVKEYKEAAGGLRALINGKSPNEHQKKAIKTVAIHAALVIGPAAVSGGLSAGLHHALPHLAHGFIEHALALRGAQVALFASAAEPSDDELMEKMLKGFAKYLEEGNIDWKKAFDEAKPEDDEKEGV